MTERNMLPEGFMYNTLNDVGAVSGTQTVDIAEMSLLVDGDITSTALSTAIGDYFSLDADMGARWKLNRIQLHTDETQPLNINMSISEDGEDFYEIAISGTAPLYIGDIPESVVSGAPRYIRYRHAGAAIRPIYEWEALADDTLVNFGIDGTQTEAEIADAPIGRPSDEITTLTLRNEYDKTGTGFVVIEASGTGADNIEISLSPNGPWYGRKNLDARMPEATPFTKGDFFNGDTTIASGSAYSTAPLWNDGTSGGWSNTGFTQNLFAGGTFVALTSTSVTPSVQAWNSFTPDPGGFQTIDSPDSPVRGNFFAVRTHLYDRVKVTLSAPSIPDADFLEGPRLFWRTHEVSDFELDRSMLATSSGVNFTGQRQEFVFEVGDMTTWSGAVRSLRVQPWTTATGIGRNIVLHDVEVYHQDRLDRVVLPEEPTTSGLMMYPVGGSWDTDYNTVVNTDNKVTVPCIMTSVHIVARPITTENQAIMLLRIKDPSTLPPYTMPSVAGDSFEMKQCVIIDQSNNSNNNPSPMTIPVWWPAEPGDMLAYSWKTQAGVQSFGTAVLTYGAGQTEDPTRSGADGGCLLNSSYMSEIESGVTLQELEDQINGFTNWHAPPDRKYGLSWKAISSGGFTATGSFQTDVIDGGGDPALLSLDFESNQANGSSIDIFTAAAPAKTVEAKASERPADVSLNLDRARNWDGKSRSLPGNTRPTVRKGYQYYEEPITEALGAFWCGMHPMGGRGIEGLRYHYYSPEFTNSYCIGMQNPDVEAKLLAEGTSATDWQGGRSVENIGSQSFHHEIKDEMWILNLMVSGTETDDARPIWDVYQPDTGEYIRTDHMTGDLDFIYTNEGLQTNTLTGRWTFEPVLFMPDYDREEIFIVCRRAQWHIGAGDYMGLVMDLDGNYKNIFFRYDIVYNEMVADGISTTDAGELLVHCQNMTYDGRYFYSLTTRTANTRGLRDRMCFYRLDDIDSDTPYTVGYVNEVNLLSVPGNQIDISDINKGPQCLAYRPHDGLIYYLQRSTPTKLDTWQVSVLGDVPDETLSVAQGPVTKDTGQFATTPELFMHGGFGHADAGNKPAWDGNGYQQDLSNFQDLTCSTARDSLWVTNTLRSECSEDLVRVGETMTNAYLFRWHNHTSLQEVGANSIPITDQPGLPNFEDPVWGTTSGTLDYESVQDNALLFPTGRYARVKYTLNASPDGLTTPELLSSQITQGLRVEDIPASGTKDIYMRTNIPSDTTIGDQTGSLKVFWQLEE